MKIEKLPSGSYRIRKMYKGVTYTVVFDSKPTQKEIMQALTAEMDKAPVPKARMTFQTAAESYISVKDNVLSPATIRGYESVLRSISMTFKKLLISDITSVDVQKEVNRYSTNHSAKTVRNMHGFINAVLSMYAPNTILNTTLPLYIKNEDYIPTDNDIKAILQAAKGTRYEVALILAAFGLRRSEICALTAEDIQNGYIIVNKAKVQNKDKQWIIKQTKTANGTRTVNVPNEVTNHIKQIGLYTGHPNNILKFLGRTQDALGIQHFSLHKFRHYYASICHYLGIPDNYIMLSGGWKTDNILKSVYRHALSDKNADMQKISGEHIKSLFL